MSQPPNIYQIFYNNLIFSYYCDPSQSDNHNPAQLTTPAPPFSKLDPSLPPHFFLLTTVDNKCFQFFWKVNTNIWKIIDHLLSFYYVLQCKIIVNICNTTPRKTSIHLLELQDRMTIPEIPSNILNGRNVSRISILNKYMNFSFHCNLLWCVALSFTKNRILMRKKRLKHQDLLSVDSDHICI